MSKWVLLILVSLIVVSCDKNNDDPTPIPEEEPEKLLNPIYSLSIDTPNGVGITSKDEYVKEATFTLTTSTGELDYSGVTNIKGRGNSTWGAPKKPYAIKLDEKASLMSLPKDKSWVLLANYYDPTLLRNAVAFFMGNELSNLDYTPHFNFVNLTLNGQYQGIYQLGEKIKISKDRVNVGDDGFLLEIDAKYSADDIIFWCKKLQAPINIKEPDVVEGDDNYNYVNNFVFTSENVLLSDSFLDENTDYQQYYDIDSFVDWYLINEIAKNRDAIFFSSCYMSLERGGKLKMGPLWDFDVAFGNYFFEDNNTNEIHNSVEGFWVRYGLWINRMFEDPSFVDMVKTRFNFYFDNRETIYKYIDSEAEYISEFIVDENKHWGLLSSPESENNVVIAAYNKEVEKLKSWLELRFQWLNDNL